MALNWCYCEPWKTAVNNSLIAYPAAPRKAYEAVKAALRPVLASARIPRFDWRVGDIFSAEIWLLNDSAEDAREIISVSIAWDGEERQLLHWDSGVVPPNENRLGPTLNWKLPDLPISSFTLRLRASGNTSSEYKLCYRPTRKRAESRRMNV